MLVGLVGQRGRERAVEVTDSVRERLAERGVDVIVDPVTAEALGIDGVEPEALSAADLIVSVGGDGTFLYAARTAGSTPIIGVNLGEVGFLNAVTPDEAVETVDEVVDAMAAGRCEISELPRLRATGSDWTLEPAINEVLVQGARRGAGSEATFSLFVDDDRYLDGVGDGVLVATPTGSTAYNLSEGGPLVQPGTDALVVTPMCSRSDTRPLVLPADAAIELRLEDDDGGFVVADGRQRQPLTPPTTVSITAAEAPLRIAGPGVQFYQALEKLS